MNQNSRKFLTVTFCALAICLALCFAIMAWTEPAQTPPQGNVAAPINTSSAFQAKAGDLTIGGGLTITSTAATNASFNVK
jgi:hypothetical protein